MNDAIWFTTRRSYRALFLFGAAFFTALFCLCFATIPFAEAKFIAPWFMGFVMIIGWMYKATRFCPTCDRVLNRNLFDRPAWCWCGEMVEPLQVVGSTGVIDLTKSDCLSHPQPVTKTVRLLAANMVQHRAHRMTIRADGSVQFEIGREVSEFEPMPTHLVAPTAKVFNAIAEGKGPNDRREFVFRVPIVDREPITLPAEIRFRSTADGDEIVVHAERLPDSVDLAIGSKSKQRWTT